jgi:hypothetical protein
MAEHIKETAASDGRAVWTPDEPVAVRWAFVAWDKETPAPAGAARS